MFKNLKEEWLSVLAAVVCGGIAAFLHFSYITDLENRDPSVVYLRLNTAVTKGELITDAMLDSVTVPKRFESFSKVALSDDAAARRWITSRPVSSDIPAGELLLHSHFLEEYGPPFATQIQPGMRAFTIPVNNTSAVGYLLVPGDRVDIIGIFAESANGSAEDTVTERRLSSRVVLAAVSVLAVDQATTRAALQKTPGASQQRGFTTVTVELTSLQVEQITLAQNQTRGGLSLALRHPDDTDLPSNPSVTWETPRAQSQY